MLLTRKGFSQDIGGHFIGWAIYERKPTNFDRFSHVQIIQVEIFRPFMKLRILYDRNHRFVIAIQNSGILGFVPDLSV